MIKFFAGTIFLHAFSPSFLLAFYAWGIYKIAHDFDLIPWRSE